MKAIFGLITILMFYIPHTQPNIQPCTKELKATFYYKGKKLKKIFYTDTKLFLRMDIPTNMVGYGLTDSITVQVNLK